MIAIGGHRIADIRIGNSRIKEVRIGNDLVWSRGKFVVVGYDGVIAYSKDGVEWTMAESPSTSDFLNVCHGNGMFIATSSAKLVYSSDGIQWQLAETNPGVYETAYGNGRFVKVGRYGAFKYSEDGLTWTTVSGDRSDLLESVAFGNGMFVAVGEYQAARSVDGVNWERTGVSAYNPRSIAYGGGKFVYVSFYGQTQYSTDGMQWSQMKEIVSGSSDRLRSITFGNGKFVAVGNSGLIARSSDGVSWNTSYIPTGGNFASVAFGNGKFVAVGNDGVAAYSSDGENWTVFSIGIGYLPCITFG